MKLFSLLGASLKILLLVVLLGQARPSLALETQGMSTPTSSGPSLKDFGASIDGDWTRAVQAAENSKFPVIYLPEGKYPTVLNRFQVTKKIYVGPGQIVFGSDKEGKGGRADAKGFRVIVTTPPASMTTSTDEMLSNDVSTIPFTAYKLVTKEANPPPTPKYNFMPQFAMQALAWNFGAGRPSNLDGSEGGRTGAAMLVHSLTAGGQGDVTMEYNRAEIYSQCPTGAKHFGACPAIGLTGGGDVGVTAGSGDGKYLQFNERNVRDGGTSAAAALTVVNMYRSNNSNELQQQWAEYVHSSRGTKPIDVFETYGGPAKQGLNFSAADFSDGGQAMIVGALGQRIYLGGSTTPDSAGLRLAATSLGSMSLWGGSDGNIHLDAGPGKTTVLSNLPPAATGLPSGALWRDQSRANLVRAAVDGNDPKAGWTAYTPNVVTDRTSTSVVTNASARAEVFGKAIHVRVKFEIATPKGGRAGSAMYVDLPNGVIIQGGCDASGHSTSGKSIQAYNVDEHTPSRMILLAYDGSSAVPEAGSRVGISLSATCEIN